jgi:hypothetical protein
MFALLVGVSGRSAGAAKSARASAAKSSGRAELATGAWAMSDAYINRTATKSCGEPVQAWCDGWVTHGDVSNASLELAASDYVVTFEMAEHVPRKFESTLLDLIDRAATRGVMPTAWVDAPIASEMARQGTDMRRCGQNRCCRSAVEAQCIRGLRRNTTCMTAWLEA